jgi:DNA polymerase I
MQSETLSLNDVAYEFLGERKNDFEFEKIKSINPDDWKDFFAYNLQDSKLTYKLMQSIWADISEFTKIMQEPVFDVSRNSMSSNVEDYILHNLERFNEIAEKRPIHDEISKRRAREKYEGAFVFQPEAGIYQDIAIFDFASMHASIIVSFNIGKTSLLDKKEKNAYESPEFKFNNKKTKF